MLIPTKKFWKTQASKKNLLEIKYLFEIKLAMISNFSRLTLFLSVFQKIPLWFHDLLKQISMHILVVITGTILTFDIYKPVLSEY